MRFTVLWAVNLMTALAILYLYTIYGKLHWWWIRFGRTQSNPAPREVSIEFWGALENIHVVCVILAGLLLASNLCLLKWGPAKSHLGQAATVLSAMVLLVCIFLST